MNRFWKKFWSEDGGQNTAEYAMLLMLISLALIAAGSGFSARVASTIVNTSIAVSAAATPHSVDASSAGKGPRLIGDSASSNGSNSGRSFGGNSGSGTKSQGHGRGGGAPQGTE